MEQTVQNMMKKVDEFHRNITNRPYGMDLPTRGNYDHLIEEVNETVASHERGDRAGVIDGLVDMIYVALGAMLEMGVDPNTHFDEVHRANMRKIPRITDRYGPGINDAVKPEGWVGPDHQTILDDLDILHKVSPIFVELTKLRIKKGKNYNRGTVKRSDHFPFGDLSFAQVLWMKMCRIRSLVECPDDDSRRLVERELNDILVYGCFWAEFMKGIDVP